jgi:hypothetical protein
MAEIVDRVTTNLQSARVLVTMLVVGLVALAAWWLARRRGAGWRSSLAVGAVPVLIASVVLVAPYFRHRELVEALPTVSPTASPSPGGTPSATGELRRAALRGLGGHSAKGSVALHLLADGTHLVRFESVDIEGTPTPYVYVLPGEGKDRPGGDKLGRLKAERGSFNYPVSRPDGAITVLVWCERFAVPIAGATLTP